MWRLCCRYRASSGSIDAAGGGNGGQVSVESAGGDVTLGTDTDSNINTSAANGNGGAVDLDSAGSLAVAPIDASSAAGTAGTVALDAADGIAAGDINATGTSAAEGDQRRGYRYNPGRRS